MEFAMHEIDNLLYDLCGKLLPEHIDKKEVGLLEKKFGANWFNILGYIEPEYKKPVFK